ncbi:MAG: ABC transporter permease, partial [Actinobacteria bacterium]|nr:ABC transporter permease [Actinomycetota bacterium]
MRGFIVRRLCGAFATFLVATMVVFTITFALPGDPARTIAGRRQVPQATIDAIRARYHLDDTLPSQYLHWLGRLLRGDLGESFASRRPVTSMLVDALPVSAALLAVTLLIEIVVGVGLGAVVGVRRGGTLDRLAVGFCTAGIAAPLFVTASVAQYLFGVRWRLLPVAGSHDGVRSYVLPALVLAGIGTAFAVRTMRAEVLEQAQA